MLANGRNVIGSALMGMAFVVCSGQMCAPMPTDVVLGTDPLFTATAIGLNGEWVTLPDSVGAWGCLTIDDNVFTSWTFECVFETIRNGIPLVLVSETEGCTVVHTSAINPICFVLVTSSEMHIFTTSSSTGAPVHLIATRVQ